VGKRQVFFDHRKERNDDGRIFKKGPRKDNHRKMPFRLAHNMAVVYHTSDKRGTRIIVERTVAEGLTKADNQWRIHKKGW
jgi:hypothetical protein